MSDWRIDKGKAAYKLPLIVDTPRGKEDISDWAKDKIRYEYWLELRAGDGSGMNARVCVPEEVLITLEHGKRYDPRDICCWWYDSQRKPIPGGVTFIVEKL